MPGRRDGEDSHAADDLGEMWRWGLETSQLMGERVLELYQDLGKAAVGGDLVDELRRARIDMERWVDLSVEVFDRTFSVLQRLAADGDGGDGGGRMGNNPDVLTV